MRTLRLVIAAAVVLGAPVTALAQTPAKTNATVIALLCGHLIDAQAGKLRGETTVVIEGGRIRAVMSGHAVPAGATEIDLSKQTCMPGFVDCHTHLTSETSPTSYTEQVSLEHRRLLDPLDVVRSAHPAGWFHYGA